MVHDEINQQDHKPTCWENLFVIFVLILSTGAVFPLLQVKSEVILDPIQGNTVLQIIWLGIYIITLLLLFFNRQKVLQIAFKDKLILLLVLIPLLSTCWSSEPLLTLRRSVAFLGTTAFGMYLLSRYTWQELFKMLVWTFGLIAVISIIFTLILPSYGFHYNGEVNLVGVYENKNIFGALISLAALTWFLYAFINPNERLVGFCFSALSLVLLILTHSITAIIIFFILLPLLLIYPVISYFYIQGKKSMLFIFLAIGLLIILLIIFNWQSTLFALGKNMTLTGRI